MDESSQNDLEEVKTEKWKKKPGHTNFQGRSDSRSTTVLLKEDDDAHDLSCTWHFSPFKKIKNQDQGKI